MYDYLDSVINLSWMYMHDKKRDLLWQTRIIMEVYFFVVQSHALFTHAKEEMEEARNKLAEAEQARHLLQSKTVVNTKFPS